ncbi:hypothetical protein V1509DRAFT_635867, partial [Lipomyces kononenkoae]
MSALVATAASSWRTGFFYGSPLCVPTLHYVFLAGRTSLTLCSSQNSARTDKRSICLNFSFLVLCTGLHLGKLISQNLSL